MDEMIGYCGYGCGRCAARSDDPEIRQKLVDGWRKIFGLEMYTVENVRCDGCRANGRLADRQCQARPCAMQLGVESCALCEDFICDKVRGLLSGREEMLTRLHKRLRTLTQEEYDLCMSQFDSFPNLIKVMAEAEKLPKWTTE